jgi:hypothetical protein
VVHNSTMFMPFDVQFHLYIVGGETDKVAGNIVIHGIVCTVMLDKSLIRQNNKYLQCSFMSVCPNAKKSQSRTPSVSCNYRWRKSLR